MNKSRSGILVVVVGLVAWILVAESVFIPISKAAAALDHEKAEEEQVTTTYRKSQEEEEEDEETMLLFKRLNAELFAKIDILDSETFAQEFSKIGRLYVEEIAKIDEKRVKRLLLEKDIHIPDISVQDQQLLRLHALLRDSAANRSHVKLSEASAMVYSNKITDHSGSSGFVNFSKSQGDDIVDRSFFFQLDKQYDDSYLPQSRNKRQLTANQLHFPETSFEVEDKIGNFNLQKKQTFRLDKWPYGFKRLNSLARILAWVFDIKLC